MKYKFKFFVLGVCLVLFACGGDTKKSLTDYADPTIGGVSVLLETTRQTIHLPNEMLRFVPLRSSMLDDWIDDFALQMPNHRRHWVFGFMPFCSPDPESMWSAPGVCNNEETHPHYYRAQLDGVTFEFAPAKKSGIIRMTFDGEGQHSMRFRSRTPIGFYDHEGNRVVKGTAEFGQPETKENMTAYLYAEFDCDMHDIHYPGEDTKHLMLTAEDGKKVVTMRYGISYIDEAQAKANMEREIQDFNFDRVKDEAKKTWEKRLGQIEVSGGTEAHKRTFYTALYRCSERMVDINEYGRFFSAWDRTVHEAEEPFYVDNWLWDTHIALEPLQTILNPKMELQKINSLIEMYKESGIMPRFALTSGEWAAMTGNFAAVWMLDAWVKGLRFDLETAYEGFRKNSLERSMPPPHRSTPSTPLMVTIRPCVLANPRPFPRLTPTGNVAKVCQSQRSTATLTGASHKWQRYWARQTTRLCSPSVPSSTKTSSEPTEA